MTPILNSVYNELWPCGFPCKVSNVSDNVCLVLSFQILVTAFNRLGAMGV